MRSGGGIGWLAAGGVPNSLLFCRVSLYIFWHVLRVIIVISFCRFLFSFSFLFLMLSLELCINR